MLGHLEAGDLVPLLKRDLAVVVDQKVDVADDLLLLRLIPGEGGTLLADGDSGDLGAVILGSEARKGAPAATDVQKLLAFLEVDFVAGNGHLVLLGSLEAVALILEDSAGVKHGGAQKPGVKVVAAVVDLADSLLVHFH